MSDRMFEFTALGLKAACREVAADRPGFKYEPRPWILEDGTDGSTMGRYTEQDGTPGCIIGQGVYYITGETVDEAAMGGGVCHVRWADALGVDMNKADDNYRAWQWLCALQAFQDFRHTWGEAVKRADEGYAVEQASTVGEVSSEVAGSEA